MNRYVIVDENNVVVQGPILWDGLQPLALPEGLRPLPEDDQTLIWDETGPSTDPAPTPPVPNPDLLEEVHTLVLEATSMPELKYAISQMIDVIKQAE